MFPPGHFYSPIVDPNDVHVQRAVGAEAHPQETIEGVRIDESEMQTWFDVIAKHYAEEPFSFARTAGSLYFYDNPNFPLADALALLAFVETARSRRFIEIGSGYSSCAAIDINERYCSGRVEMTFIDPNPEQLLALLPTNFRYSSSIRRTKVQDVPLELFASLSKGDILFIDSSHVAKAGSDVVDYLFRILPALASGVLIHIHDVFFPFEYPADWVLGQGRSWNETYFVRAFLFYNPLFRILFFSDWFYKCRRDLLARRMPLWVEYRGGSLWLEKGSG